MWHWREEEMQSTRGLFWSRNWQTTLRGDWMVHRARNKTKQPWNRRNDSGKCGAVCMKSVWLYLLRGSQHCFPACLVFTGQAVVTRSWVLLYRSASSYDSQQNLWFSHSWFATWLSSSDHDFGLVWTSSSCFDRFWFAVDFLMVVSKTEDFKEKFGSWRWD